MLHSSLHSLRDSNSVATSATINKVPGNGASVGAELRRSTIKDVAKRAKVSLKTVSRVINNEPAVQQRTRDKVLRAIEHLDYQPDLSARSLRSAQSFALGVVYDNPNPYYIISVQNGVL